MSFKKLFTGSFGNTEFDVSSFHSPFNTSNEKDEVAVDFGAVDEFIDVAGVHGLSCLQAARPYAITH